MTLQQLKYTAIGDVGIDIYPTIAKEFPGGMALNSAFHATRAGAQASIISAIGTDQNAQIIAQFCDTNCISHEMLTVRDGDTDSVEIVLDESNIPQYQNWDLGVLGQFQLNISHESFLRSQDVAIAVYLPELNHLFKKFSKMTLPNTLKVGDFTDLSEHNGDQYILNEYTDCFDIFALSIDEHVAERLESFSSFISSHKKMGIALLGERGSAIISDGKQYTQDAKRVKVVDTTGAGDAYLATFLVHFLRKNPMPLCMKKATHIASKVIKGWGATRS